ncbi:subtilase-type protease inhibitor [Planotetraspora sp. A-T 1434]|uniref:subtilase-type protease inhibitor n=1 Tax=Planotetraspora sp. A-T 1434 TaxID=2979219 RepID=UPI0021C10246|nr:subtilase-type protease inhibitor [Planotetraspora sp. A-T 1434]MCT9931271.1 subtilase-type protease inhibitor [Planotetraspora sp. A-T 1434]
MILTSASGEKAQPPERYALLSCTPTAGARLARTEACDLLEKAKGDPANLQPSRDTYCPMMFSPVTVTATGIWDGRFVRFEHTFGNACELRSTAGSIFDI